MTAQPPLDKLARRFGTDKSSEAHGFTEIYESLLSAWRDRPVTVLEIGVYRGASLRMWRDYFPLGRIVGIDKDPDASDHAGGRIDVRIGHQADAGFLEDVATADGPFDLIVDDGSHLAKGQKTSLRCLWPHLKPGGVYAVEDIHTSYLENFGGGWRRPQTTVEFLKDVIDDVHQPLHGRQVTLEDMESIHFYYELCVIHRARRPIAVDGGEG